MTVKTRPPIDPTRCTFLRCPSKPTKRLQQSTGGRPWFGCAKHYPAMIKALEIGMPGVTSGGSWVAVSKP